LYLLLFTHGLMVLSMKIKA